eukprot:GCRY01001248.1.p1 GENE.GCRY01001248.1~~GCRY01001248.1.p1  ORF type:complete len:304 (-),score=56.67 GCRY01001248.1:147-1058(-)
MTYRCRWYENQFPEVDDLVMVNVNSIAEMGAYVTLVEYNNIEGMILLSELSRRRIRSVNKLIRVGRQEIVVVLRVDKEKGYIDLSKRRVTAEDVKKFEDRYNKSKAVHSIMRHVAEKCHVDLEELYTKFGWPLYRKYGHAYDALKLALNGDMTILDGYDLTDVERQEIEANIVRRLTPQAVKLRSDFEITCFQYEGIEAVKEALIAGKAISEDKELKIKLIAPPLFVMLSSSMEKEPGMANMNNVLEKIKEIITAKNGTLNVTREPRPVSESDDKALDRLMEEMEKANLEVDGDDDVSEEEES